MLNWKKHKIIIVQILKDIYSDIEISSFLGFKGGTACLFFYDLPRNSVDLDFDLLDMNKKDIVYKKIESIIAKYGEVKEKRIKRNTIFFLLSYGEFEQNIKIEISIRDLDNNFEILDYFGVSMKVMVREDVFANKLVALTNRGKIAMRDIFDLYFFFSSNWEINEEIIKNRTKKNLNEYLLDCIDYIEDVPNNNVMQGLGQLVDKKQKEWVKNNLKKDLVYLIRNYIE